MEITGRTLIKKYFLIVFTVILITASMPVTVRAAEASVTFGSERYDKENGEQFPVGVYLNGDSIVADYHVELRYDCLRLKYISGADEVDEENGILTFESGASAEQVKLWLTFEAISGGEAHLAVDTAVATAPNGDSFSMTLLQEVSVYIAGEDIVAAREAVNGGTDGSQGSDTGDGAADSGSSGGTVAGRWETDEGTDIGESGSSTGTDDAESESDTGRTAVYEEQTSVAADSFDVSVGQASVAEDTVHAGPKDPKVLGIVIAEGIGITCVIGTLIAIIYLYNEKHGKRYKAFRDVMAARLKKQRDWEYDEAADYDDNTEYNEDQETGYGEDTEYDVSVEYDQNIRYDQNKSYNAVAEYDQSIVDDAGIEYGEDAEYDASVGYDQSTGYNADTEYDQDTKYGMSTESGGNVGCDADTEYDWDTGYDEPAENGEEQEFSRNREPDTDAEPEINKKVKAQKRKGIRKRKKSDRRVEAADQGIANAEFSKEISSDEDVVLSGESDTGERTEAAKIPVTVPEEEGEIPIIKVENVTMRFKVATSSTSGLKDYVIQRIKKQITTRILLALNDVSFDIFKGEVVGIIGTNGSGKSTLLKIISGGMKPTSGRVIVDKSKIQILTLGMGFDTELTARENVYLNGAIIGYSKEFIDAHFDEIVSFAELEGFMDTKVKNFSSGMFSRLGFAIATVGEAAEILILDEVLSVGDEFFRKKSLKRIREMIHGGSTVIMVSHGMGTILGNCTKVVWIEKGVLQMAGDPKIVCAAYQKMEQAGTN